MLDESRKTVLVTPSWAQDFERCEMLTQSVAEHVTGFDRHLILIDAQDESLFRSLSNDMTELILKEDLLPDWIHQFRLNRKWWWSRRGLPVRGWILQQVTKLAITGQFDAAGFCFADSDMVFVRPFDASELWRENKIRFYRDERRPHFYRSRRYRNWYGFAARQFNLGDPRRLDGAYIAQLNCMHVAHASAMQRAIEDRWQKPWQQVLLASLDFSEYILYGVYVDECAQLDFHYSTESDLCHSSWFYDLAEPASHSAFVASLDEDQVAVHIQSNLNLPIGSIKSLLAGIS